MDKNYFMELNAINVGDKTETKQGLTYLSWAWAIAEVKKLHPDMTYEVKKFGDNQLPYVFDEKTGYMVFTSVTIDGITHEMWLPVMDSANHAMLDRPYKIQTKYKEIAVAPATMFDINKTIMRCLTKNIAIHGLGLYIYAGEDLPEGEEEEIKEQPKSTKFVESKPKPEVPSDVKEALAFKIHDRTIEDIFRKHQEKSAYALADDTGKAMIDIVKEYIKENK